MAKRIEKTIATPSPLTENPSIRESVNKTIAPLITKRKRPSVRIVIGSVNNVMMGLINVLINPSTIPTIIASPYPATDTPSISFEAKKTANPFSKIEMRNRIRIMFLGVKKFE